MDIYKLFKEKLDLIREAREVMDGFYPKSFDCGSICNKSCCRGEGEIWLLPFERLFYEDNGFGSSHEGMFSVKTYENDDGTETDVLVCKGSCDAFRDERPFWCRAFPIFPQITIETDGETDEEYVSVRGRLDVRGSMCPMVRGEEDVREDFAEKVLEAADLLCSDDDMFEYFLKCGEFFTELEELYKRFAADGGDKA